MCGGASKAAGWIRHSCGVAVTLLRNDTPSLINPETFPTSCCCFPAIWKTDSNCLKGPNCSKSVNFPHIRCKLFQEKRDPRPGLARNLSFASDSAEMLTFIYIIFHTNQELQTISWILLLLHIEPLKLGAHANLRFRFVLQIFPY